MDYPDSIPTPGADLYSPAERLGLHLRDTLASDPNFYLFSPDETTSNRLQSVYEATDRAWVAGPAKPWDKHMSPSGRVIELLSENTLFAMLTGHLLSGGTGAMTSYESFFPIISSQLDQYIKFLTQSAEVAWRPPVSAVNLLSTSTCWRQDHNGFSHQNPALISTLLDKPSNLANCLFPIDDISISATWEFANASQNTINLITFNKTPEPRWIDINHARFQLENGGASIFEFASDPDPDIILTATGDIVSREALHAIPIIKQHLPDLRLRFIGISALSYGAIGTTDNKLSESTFDHYFTSSKPIIANFHGYPQTLATILSNYTDKHRFRVHGFSDHGSTTTPLDMLIRNQASRYDLAAEVFDLCSRPDLSQKMAEKIAQNTAHIKKTSLDLPL